MRTQSACVDFKTSHLSQGMVTSNILKIVSVSAKKVLQFCIQTKLLKLKFSQLHGRRLLSRYALECYDPGEIDIYQVFTFFSNKYFNVYYPRYHWICSFSREVSNTKRNFLIHAQENFILAVSHNLNEKLSLGLVKAMQNYVKPSRF